VNDITKGGRRGEYSRRPDDRVPPSPTFRERPILFSGPMVRAILTGTKTQTRRVVIERHFTPATGCAWDRDWKDVGVVRAIKEHLFGAFLDAFKGVAIGRLLCPYGAPGDRLWVRETFRQGDGSMSVHYAADPDEVSGGPWRPSIFMPRWASRIQLEVMEVRVQRLQKISDDDERAEGVRKLPLQEGVAGAWWTADVSAGIDLQSRTSQGAFRKAWDSINGKRAPWSSNPWVWVISFKRVA
jgi:hypothetical protein